jgi:hypothetical protein
MNHASFHWDRKRPACHERRQARAERWESLLCEVLAPLVLGAGETVPVMRLRLSGGRRY